MIKVEWLNVNPVVVFSNLRPALVSLERCRNRVTQLLVDLVSVGMRSKLVVTELIVTHVDMRRRAHNVRSRKD
jgi:ribulose bisphosphate carboxylase small subunit